MRILLAVLFVVPLVAAHAQHEKVTIKATPSWVKPIPYGVDVRDTTNLSGGYYDLLVDDQFHVPAHESFHRYAQKVVSETGLENISSISVNFNPSFEQIIFHNIDVIRGGKKISQFGLGKFEVLRREENLERLMYDGSLTAVFNIHDLQVNDILEYSFSKNGRNPLYGDKYAKIAYLNFGAPVGVIFCRVVTDAKKEYQLKKFNGAEDPLITNENGHKILEWIGKDVPAVVSDDAAPNWYDPYRHVQISDFGSWADFSGWAEDLFDLKAPAGGLLAKIPGVDKSQSEESIQRIIQFVQDEIRYLSFSEGIHAYKPHPPAKILSQRFGDCKDKSLLLSTLLREIGVKSDPVLVSTSYGKTLVDYLPAPSLFNHCIVRFELHDSIYWVDPTMTSQRGNLRRRYTPYYYYGAVVSRANKDLVEMSRTRGGSIKAMEDYQMDSIGGAARLTVTTVYTLEEADVMRDYLKSNSVAYVQKQYLNFYASDFPEISTAAPFQWTDNESNNSIESKEQYVIKNFWILDSAKNTYTASIYPRFLASYMTKPATKIRTAPFSLRYPTTVDQEIVVHFPDVWSVTPNDQKIKAPGFSHHSIARYDDKKMYLNYRFEIDKPWLESGEVREYVAKIDEALNNLQYNLTRNLGSTRTADFNFPFALIAVFTVAGCSLMVRFLYKLDPQPQPSPERYNGIGGWLILPAIGICLSPLVFLFQVMQAEFFSYANWEMLAVSSAASYDPWRGFFVLCEMILNIVVTVYGIFVAYMFFQRRTSVPALMIGFYLASFGLIAGDRLVAMAFGIEADQETIRTIIRSGVTVAIWVPYFMVSTRAKGTFTVRRKPPLDPEMQTVYRLSEETA